MASFYDLFALDPDEKAAIEFADRLTPAQALMAERRQFQQGAVRGVENIGRAALGVSPSPTQNRAQAARELQELATKVRPGTPEFYATGANILRKYGLVAEAEQMQKNLQALEVGKGEMDPTMKMQRAYDELKKRFDAGDVSVKPALDALKRRLDVAGKERPVSANDPEFVKLLNAYEAALEAGQSDRAAMLKTALDAWIKQKETSGNDVQWARLLLEKRRLEDAEEKEKRKVKGAEATIVSALQSTVRAIDQDLQSAERLLVHPGLPWITGKWAGLGGRLSAAVTSAAAGANALLMNVHAQTFIRALQDLKATSRTGASGLGQLTEREGDKIQNAKVALDPQQPTDQFKRTLKQYIESLRSARNTGADEVTKAGAEAPAAPAPVSDVSPQVDPRAVTPPAAPATKPKFKATRVG